MKFDETQPVKGLFADIEEQASAGLKERITASTGPMLLLYNGMKGSGGRANQREGPATHEYTHTGQQLATSAEQTADKERRPLRDVPCWPKEPDSEHIPILQLYVPKRYSDVDKPGMTHFPLFSTMGLSHHQNSKKNPTCNAPLRHFTQRTPTRSLRQAPTASAAQSSKNNVNEKSEFELT